MANAETKNCMIWLITHQAHPESLAVIISYIAVINTVKSKLVVDNKELMNGMHFVMEVYDEEIVDCG